MVAGGVQSNIVGGESDMADDWCCYAKYECLWVAMRDGY